MTALTRRALFVSSAVGVASLAGAGCTRRPRCSRCGMVLDEGSRFFVEVRDPARTRGFDTPKCAFSVWIREGRRGEVLVVEHYAGKKVPAGDVVFALGSDVLGPMGHDLVPVAKEHAARFQRDHGAKQLLSPSDLTQAMVDDL